MNKWIFLIIVIPFVIILALFSLVSDEKKIVSVGEFPPPVTLYESSPTTNVVGARISEDGKISHILRTFTRWVNYKTAEAWGVIDTTLKQTAGGFVMDKAPFEFT